MRFMHGGMCMEGCMGECEEVQRVHGYEKGCVEGCAEVHGGLHRCVQSGAWRGTQRCMEGCAEVCGGMHGKGLAIGCPLQPLI